MESLIKDSKAVTDHEKLEHALKNGLDFYEMKYFKEKSNVISPKCILRKSIIIVVMFPYCSSLSLLYFFHFSCVYYCFFVLFLGSLITFSFPAFLLSLLLSPFHFSPATHAFLSVFLLLFCPHHLFSCRIH
jgi:hypothetical protein